MWARNVLGGGSRRVLIVAGCTAFILAPLELAAQTASWTSKSSGPIRSTSKRVRLRGGFATHAPLPMVSAATLSGDTRRTRLVLTFSKKIKFKIGTLADPYRIIIDLPLVDFKLSNDVGRRGSGLISAFRYGSFVRGKSRIVIDTTGPVLVHQAGFNTPSAGRPLQFVLELVRTNRRIFLAKRQRPEASLWSRFLESLALGKGIPKPESGRPVVIIDPGHGGIDSGASGAGSLREKDIVLKVSRYLRAKLKASNRYVVRMTRDRDVYVPLAGRVAVSQKLGATLFISVHADSLAQKAYARTVRGATIYTLSDRASDDEARLLAEKENAVDILAGVVPPGRVEQDRVKGFLIDLMKRETAQFSSDFRTAVVRHLRKVTVLHRDPRRSAAFAVLRQTRTPSILVELGYMSNPSDEKLMQSAAWQRKVASALAKAVHSYFATHRAVRVPH